MEKYEKYTVTHATHKYNHNYFAKKLIEKEYIAFYTTYFLIKSYKYYF